MISFITEFLELYDVLMAHHVIYIPGLGDSKTFGQDKGIKLLRLKGLTPHYFPLGWAKKETVGLKLGRLEKKVTDLLAKGDRVSLIGVSAGASAALRLYDKIPEIHKVVLISGKIHSPEIVSKRVYDLNPAFKQSVYGLEAIITDLQRKKRIKNIMSLRSLRDRSVPRQDSFLDGATHRNIIAFSHPSSIFVALIFYFPTMARFIKS